MAVNKALKAIAAFMFFFGIAVIIPDLTIEWFNFREFDTQVKMIFVAAAGIMGISKLVLVLEEVS